MNSCFEGLEGRMGMNRVREFSTSPEGRAVLHQAADKSFVCGQELRWAKERLCTTEDSLSATGLEARLKMWLSQERSWQIVRPRSLSERTSRGFFEKVDGGGVPNGPSER